MWNDSKKEMFVPSLEWTIDYDVQTVQVVSDLRYTWKDVESVNPINS